MKWIAKRSEKIVGVFEDRKEAIKWIKGLLSQTLKDLKPQDKTDEYDYPIHIPEYRISPVENRKDFLGL